ncbi:MAG: S8 family serine peptidase [Anaerolineae bacterium]
MSATRRLLVAAAVALILLLAAAATLAQGPSPDPSTNHGLSPTNSEVDMGKGGAQTRLYPDRRPALATDQPSDAPSTWRVVDPDLLKAALTNPSAAQDFIVTMSQRADLSAAAAKPTRLEQRQAVVASLQATAQQSQAPLEARLSLGKAAGRVTTVEPFWVVNAVHVVGDGATLLDLAAVPGVESIRPNHSWSLDWKPSKEEEASRTSDTAEWGVQRIRADLVWSLMGIDGKGVVVASLDTGVDWQHPDLQTRYRGYNTKGLPTHNGNWFCATDEGYLYPGDGIGHGTHTMGTMVAGRGLGVAPGAQWIAVKIFNDQGRTTDAWIHNGFQWLLAPGGDPSRAPDIVNGSWGSTLRDGLVYRDDVRALLAAGILPVFAAGNSGPAAASVSIPGGYAESLTVGATDADNIVANFSSRGPTAFAPIKPDVVAPGVHIRSTFHGGGYALEDGTSMATPHVAGLAALMLQANPHLAPQEIMTLIERTARPIGDDPLPNNNYGAGLADAYAAVSTVVGAGELGGHVTRSGDRGPVRGADVTVTGQNGGSAIHTQTDATGAYTVPLRAGTYDVVVSAFGYAPMPSRSIVIGESGHVMMDVTLTLLPVGVIYGRVTDTAGAPQGGKVIVEGTPVTATVAANTGVYSLALPPGSYHLRVEQPGFRIGRADVQLPSVGAAVQQDFSLTRAPTILLVDSGAWYYADTVSYYTAALDARNYLYTVYPIRDTQTSAPGLDVLKNYDVVIWSSPSDAPGLVGADKALAAYMRGGGHLILSGQDVAYWDGGGTGRFTAEYFRALLNAAFVSDDAETDTVAGAGPFAGLQWTLNGPDSADNQTGPDVIAQVKPDPSGIVAAYGPDAIGGLFVGTCVVYRGLYFAFGIEAVRGLDARAELLDRAIRAVSAATPDYAVSAKSDRAADVAPSGSFITYTVSVRNTGRQVDTYTLKPLTATWQTQILDPVTSQPLERLTLNACQARDVLVRVSIPPTTGWNASDSEAIDIRSVAAPDGSSQLVRLTSKTPAPLLLVDDNPWKDVHGIYTQALTSAAIPYDTWRVGEGSGGPGSPPAQRLAMYPVVLWFTGYDFLDTLAPADEAALAAYLNGGGRLLLSSQDYLYTAGLTQFGVQYMGILTYTEDMLTDGIVGVHGDDIGDGLGPYPLDFAGVFGSTHYNHTDAIGPTGYASASFLGVHGQPVAIHLDKGPYRTAFFALPLETLSQDALVAVLRRTVGWLQPLGASQVLADRSVVADGDTLTYSIRLVNRSPSKRAAVYLYNPIPAHATLIPGSVSGAFAAGDRVLWNGALAANGEVDIRYKVALDHGLSPGTQIVNSAWVGDETGLVSELRHTARVNVPDLSGSSAAADRDALQPGQTLNYLVTLRNRGTLDAAATLTATLPVELAPVAAAATASAGTARVEGNTVYWTGPVADSGAPVVVTWDARVTDAYRGGPLRTQILINDGFTDPIDRSVVVGATRRIFLPLLVRQSRP